MSQHDPFEPIDDSDRTLLRPTPGPRSVSASPSPRPTPSSDRPWDRERTAALAPHGLNPLLASANPLIALAVQLRTSDGPPALDPLHDDLVRLASEFEATAKRLGADPDLAEKALYCVCTFVDEAIATTPWGGGGRWYGKSLQVHFGLGAAGGENFFRELERASQKPRETIDLLELMYVCLAHGFVGRYRMKEDGQRELTHIRERLYQTIHSVRGEFERNLSPRWQPVKDRRYALVRWLPLWVVAAGACAILLGVYLIFAWALNRTAYPVWEALQTIPGLPPAPVQAAAPVDSNLAGLLAPDIQAGLIEVQEQAGRATVTIQGDGLFESGSATIKPQYEAVLLRIADALNSVPGLVVVGGHTDDRPMMSARFRNNWQLSKARADAVVDLMEPRMTAPERLKAEGHADKAPRADNDTAEHRAMNRRVEITVHTGAHGATRLQSRANP